MKNTNLLIGLAIGGGLAYLYLKDKKSSPEPSFTVGYSTYYIQNGKYYQKNAVQCIKAPCPPEISEISKAEYDNAKLKIVASMPTVPNGSELPKGDAVAEYKPVYKGYDPAYNDSLEMQKQAKAFYESEFYKSRNPSNSIFEKIVNPFGGAPKVLPSSTDYVITPDYTQGVVRNVAVNDIAIDKMPNVVNQEDIELFFFNNPNISSIEDNTIRDAKGYPIYQKIRKSDIQKDALGAIVSGYANGDYFYKENGKFYTKEPTNAGINPLASAYIICEISESDWLNFFINVKDGSYRKIKSPAIQKLNCSTYRNGVKSIW